MGLLNGPQLGDPGYVDPITGHSVDANGNVIDRNGNIVPPGDWSQNHDIFHDSPLTDAIKNASGGMVDPSKGTIGIDPTVAIKNATSQISSGQSPNAAIGDLGVDPSLIVQRVVDHAVPIYQTGDIKGPVPTPFGGSVNIRNDTGNTVVDRVGNSLAGLAKNLKSALGGQGPQAVPPPNVAGVIGGTAGGSGGGGGGPNAGNFFQQLAQARSQTPAPQLQRTSIDFSGMGSGQGPAPVQPAPAQYPGQTAPPGTAGAAGAAVGGGLSSIMGGSGPPPAGQQPPSTVAGQDAMMKMQRDLYAPPATSGSPPPPPSGTASGMAPSVFNPSGGSATSTYSSAAPANASNQRVTPGAAQPAITEQPVRAAPQPTQGYQPGPQAPPPPPAQPAPASGTGQFANPLFGQSQQTRAVEGQVMGGIMSPTMYATPQRASADASRDVQGQVMAATTDPNVYRNPAEREQAQTRQQQQGLVSLLGRDLNGGQPSLAEIQMRQGTDESIAAANALAASAGPGNANAAARQAADIAAKTRQGLVGQTAALRAQEYAKAREEAGQVTATGRAQDITNQGQQYQNVTNLSQLAASQARDLRGQDLQDLGMSYKNATDKAGLASQLAVQSRAQDLQALGMSYDNAIKQAQLEVEQNKAQLGADISQRQINASSEQGLLQLGQGDKELDQQQRLHLADLMMQQYGIDKNVALQMIGNSPLDRVFKGIAAGGAAGGIPGAIVGGAGALTYNYLS